MLTAAWIALRGFFAANALSILKWVAIAGAILTVLLGARRSGRQVERLESYERELEGVRERQKIEREHRDADDADVDRWLRRPRS